MAAEDLPSLELAFPGPERDSGVAAILAGDKTALTGLLQIFEQAGGSVPQPGQRFAVLDSAAQPPSSNLPRSASSRSAWPMTATRAAEGRGYADATEWRRAHEDFFRSEGVAGFLGGTPVIGDGTLVVTERFRLINPGNPSRTRPPA